MDFDPYNHSLEIQKSIKTPTPSFELQFLKCEFTWECGGSIPHTFPHSWEHEMWLPSFILGSHLRKPNAREALVNNKKTQQKGVDE